MSTPHTIEGLDLRRVDREPGGSLAVWTAGDAEAPPLLVLHGAAGSTRTDTAALALKWARGFYVVAPDFTGHAASDDFPETPLTLARFADDAVAALDALGLADAHVFGWSLGGAVALKLAAAYPDRVRRAVAHSSSVIWKPAEIKRQRRAFTARYVRALAPAWAERLASAQGEDRWESVLGRVLDYIEGGTLQMTPDELGAITSPTLISGGDRDRYLEDDTVLRHGRAIPGSQVAVHPGLDHDVQDADPAAFAAFVSRFLLGSDRPTLPAPPDLGR